MHSQESPPASVLLVDDDTSSLHLITTILRMRYPTLKAYSAETAEAGLELFKSHRHDFVITDVNLFGADGVQLATEIKRLSTKTRIIVLSGHSKDDYIHRLSGLDVSHCLQKPIEFSQLFTAIEDTMRALDS